MHLTAWFVLALTKSVRVCGPLAVMLYFAMHNMQSMHSIA